MSIVLNKMLLDIDGVLLLLLVLVIMIVMMIIIIIVITKATAVESISHVDASFAVNHVSYLFALLRIYQV